MTERDERAEELRMLHVLKRLYKAAGLRYAQVALELDVSEMTVKRYMAGIGLSLHVLKKLCLVANTTIFELAQLAAQEDAVNRLRTDDKQEEALAGDNVLTLTFILLSDGWTADKIAKEFQLDHIAITKYLSRLDHLGLIMLFPANRVRVLRKLEGVRGGPLMDVVARRARELFGDISLHVPGLEWKTGLARLSRSSYEGMVKRLWQFRDEFIHLTEQDRETAPEDVVWCTLIAAMRPISMEMLLGSELTGQSHKM